MKPIVSNDRNQTLGPHLEEAALLARPSRRMAAGTISLVAVLRDARIEIGCRRFRHFLIAEVGQVRLRCALLVRKSKTTFSACRELEKRLSYAVVGPAGGQLRTGLMDDVDMIGITETCTRSG